MVVQPVTVDGKTKHALFYTGIYEGFDAYDDPMRTSFVDGFYFTPRLTPQVVNTGITKQDFDENGERRRIWKAAGQDYVHYKKSRMQFINKHFFLTKIKHKNTQYYCESLWSHT